MDFIIRKAKCSFDGNEYELNELQRMNDHDDYNILHNLECIKCGCKLTFQHRGSFRREYLKTKNDEKHSPDCKQFFKKEEQKVMYKTGQVVNGRLNENALDSRLDRMTKKLLSPSDPVYRQPASKNKKPNSKVITPKTKRKTEKKIQITTNPLDREISKSDSKNLRVPQLMADQVTNASVGKTIILGGYLEKITINSKERMTILISKGNKGMKINLRPNVFQRQIGFFDRMVSLHNICNGRTEQKFRIAISAGVAVELSANNEVETALLTENALRVNGSVLGVFISTNA